jgi:hypothetical protein
MAFFGRNTARQRLRRAARESLKNTTFSSAVDCAPWVTGGLWPAELSIVTAETAPLVKYLKSDLQRIVNSANEELVNIRRAGWAGPTRQAEEARVVNEARAFAIRRVESTVRHLHTMKSKLPTPQRPVDDVHDTEKTTRFILAPAAPAPAAAHDDPPAVDAPAPVSPQRSEARHRQPDGDEAPLPSPERSEPAQPKHAMDSDDTEVLDLTTLLQEISPLPEWPAEEPAEPRPVVPPPESSKVTSGPMAAVDYRRQIEDAEVTRNLPVVEPTESDAERLARLLKFVARQEPGLRWAVGIRDDGSTVLVTDLAHGWIPSGLTLPADVQLLEPARRTGNARALLGPTTLSATYAPGDPLGWATDYEVTETSGRARELPVIEDLGWLLSEATHWRDGLPGLVHTLAKAGAAGTGVVEAEIDILRVYLDTSRYQLLAQYPDVDPGLLLNCLLLAATDGIATQDRVSANYHYAWFQSLSAPPASGWKSGP